MHLEADDIARPDVVIRIIRLIIIRQRKRIGLRRQILPHLTLGPQTYWEQFILFRILTSERLRGQGRGWLHVRVGWELFDVTMTRG
jgi:hypothetical protein